MIDTSNSIVYIQAMTKQEIGTYVLKVGSKYYVGSSWNVYFRKCHHVSDLRGNKHSNHKLQAAWNESPEQYELVIVDRIAIDANDTPITLRDKLKIAEQALLDKHFGDCDLCNLSSNARFPSDRPDLAAKWKQPEFRDKMLKVIRNRPVASKETRKRMSNAKLGASNPKSRAVTITWRDGNKESFESGRAAADRLGVTQQLVNAWLKGIVSQPGQGKTCRKKHLIGICVSYS